MIDMLSQHTIRELNFRMDKAERNYGPVKNQAECIGALKLEVWEVMDAMHERADWKIEAELYDVANVAIRFAQKLRAEVEARHG